MLPIFFIIPSSTAGFGPPFLFIRFYAGGIGPGDGLFGLG